MFRSATACRLEAMRFRAYLSRALVLGTLLLWAFGCGVQNPPLRGSRAAPNLRLASGDATTLLRNAQYLKIIGQPALALKDLEEAHRLYPGNMKVTDALAHSYDKLGMHKRAQEIYQEALAREPDNPVMLNNLGFSYYLAGNWSQAEKCFRQILARHPDNQTARNNLGLVLCHQGRQEEARKLWQEAEGKAVAAQKIRQALTILGKAETNRSVRPTRIKPGSQLAPGPGKVAAAKPAVTRPPAKMPASYHPAPPAPKPDTTRATDVPSLPRHTGPVAAGDRTPPPPAPKKARAAAPLTPGPAPKIVAAAKPGEKNIKPAAANKPAPQGRTAGKAIELKLKPDRPKYLTAKELMETKIAILNGNGSHDLAHEARSRLSLEGFNVVDIGNYRDFGVARTMIYYRPDAKHVAMFLNHRFFPGAKVEPSPQLADRIDIKVILGHDLSQPQRAEASRSRMGKSL
jgi:Tfp pilus assembly protein PilF